MKRMLALPVVLGCAVVVSSCSSFAYLFSDDYLQAEIHVTTNRADTTHLRMVSRWSSEFIFTYSAEDVGAWAANRLAKEGRHDLLVFVELISACNPPYHGDPTGGDMNMWRISVYSVPAKDAAAPGDRAPSASCLPGVPSLCATT